MEQEDVEGHYHLHSEGTAQKMSNNKNSIQINRF